MQVRNLRALLALTLAAGCGGGTSEGPDRTGAAAGPESPTAASKGDPRPHLILVSIDTLRADRLGAYGAERDTSPTFDALSEQGLLFENAFSTASWTLMAHLSMLTGLYIDQHGVRTADRALNEEIRPLAARLSEAGYDTAGFYVDGWIHPRHGFARGFDLFEPHEDVLEAEQHLGEFFDDRDSERPLFLFLHLFDLHSVNLGPRAALMYDPPDAYARLFRANAPDQFEPGDVRAMWNRQKQPTPDQYDALRALYDGGVRYVDDRLAILLEDWTGRGLLDDALLVVTSDHGEALGFRKGRLDGHGGIHQEGLRIPLLLRAPDGRRAGERVTDAVSIVDLAPTLLAAAGLPHDDLLGRDLFSVAPAPDRVLRVHTQSFMGAIRWPHKAIATQDEYAPFTRRNGWVERLDTDPAGLELLRFESHPTEFKAGIRAINEGIAAELERGPVTTFEPAPLSGMDADAIRRLQQLGYAEELETGPDDEE